MCDLFKICPPGHFLTEGWSQNVNRGFLKIVSINRGFEPKCQGGSSQNGNAGFERKSFN